MVSYDNFTILRYLVIASIKMKEEYRLVLRYMRIFFSMRHLSVELKLTFGSASASEPGASPRAAWSCGMERVRSASAAFSAQNASGSEYRQKVVKACHEARASRCEYMLSFARHGRHRSSRNSLAASGFDGGVKPAVGTWGPGRQTFSMAKRSDMAVIYGYSLVYGRKERREDGRGRMFSGPEQGGGEED